jgi:hypothetical protein
MDGIGSFTELLGRVSEPEFLRYSRLPTPPSPPKSRFPVAGSRSRSEEINFTFVLLPTLIASILGEVVYDPGSGQLVL